MLTKIIVYINLLSAKQIHRSLVTGLNSGIFRQNSPHSEPISVKNSDIIHNVFQNFMSRICDILSALRVK